MLCKKASTDTDPVCVAKVVLIKLGVMGPVPHVLNAPAVLELAKNSSGVVRTLVRNM